MRNNFVFGLSVDR